MLAASHRAGVLRFANRRGGLQDRQQRAAEQSHLLTRDHSGGAVAQMLDILSSHIPCPKLLRLVEQQCRETLAMLRTQFGRALRPAEPERLTRIPAAQ